MSKKSEIDLLIRCDLPIHILLIIVEDSNYLKYPIDFHHELWTMYTLFRMASLCVSALSRTCLSTPTQGLGVFPSSIPNHLSTSPCTSLRNTGPISCSKFCLFWGEIVSFNICAFFWSFLYLWEFCLGFHFIILLFVCS